MVNEVLPEGLRSERRVKIEALRTLAALPDLGMHESIRALAVLFLSDPDPGVREAAIWASPAGLEWRALLDRELDPSVRRACVFQLASAEGERAVPDLIRFLRSNDWQLRAVSVEALVKLGMSVAETVKALVHDQNQHVRTAAVRVLLDLKQDSWLEREFSFERSGASL